MVFSDAHPVTQRPRAVARLRLWPGRIGALFLLLALLVQAQIAQTHIHGGAAFVTALSETSDARSGSDSPADHDEAACLLCQAVLQAGALSVPAAIPVSLPLLSLLWLIAPPAPQPGRPVEASHGWQQRAPPLPDLR